MENALSTLFMLGCVLMIIGGVTSIIMVGVVGIGCCIVAFLLSVLTGKGSSFGPRGTHSSSFPYRRRSER